MSTGLPGVIPFSLQDTLQGMNGLTMMQALQQRQQEELAQRAQAAEQAAAAAQQGYQQAAAAPPPQPPIADVFVPTLLGNLASVIAQDKGFTERAQQGIQGRRAELIKARSDNLQALRDVYSQRADEAQRAGDLETTEKYRRQFELASKTIDVLEAQKDRDARRQEAAAKEKAADEDSTVDLTGPALDTAARMYLATGAMPSMGMGKKGTAARQRIMNRAGELDPNANLALNQSDFRADRTSLGNLTKLSDAATAWEKTALRNSNVMLNAMKKIPDTGVPWLNAPIRSVNVKGLGAADQAAFRTARQVVIPEFARLLASPSAAGVLSDAARKEVESVIRGDATFNQMVATMDILKQDAQNRNQAYRDEIANIRGRLSAGGQSTATPREAATDTTVVPTGKRIRMVDTNGKPRTIDQAELKEALKHGWRRAPNGR